MIIQSTFVTVNSQPMPQINDHNKRAHFINHKMETHYKRKKLNRTIVQTNTVAI